MRILLPRFSGRLSFKFAVLLLWGSASAHHSTAEYDANPMPATIEGVITEIRWANPHVQFNISATDESGDTREWVLLEPSAIGLKKAGIGQALFDIGAPVRVYGATSRRREGRMVGWNMLLQQTGLEVILNAAQSPGPRWSDRTIGSSSSDLHSATGPVPDNRDALFRIWSWEPVGQFWMLRDPDYFPLTGRALEALSEWDVDDPSDNAVLRCVPPGMPSAMGNPHPIELVNLGGVIEIRMEEFDQVRRIHMSGTPQSASVAKSALGYSVGKWEDDELVVETTNIEAPHLTRTGVPLSPSARVQERFSVDAPNGQLDYVLTVTDPTYLTAPFVQKLVWNWHEGEFLQPYDCQIPE
jgi:Family of unknown function (DUF6152)